MLTIIDLDNGYKLKITYNKNAKNKNKFLKDKIYVFLLF